MWSLGVLAYEIWTYGDQPYKGMTNQAVWTKVSSGYRLPQPDLCAKNVYDVMLSCWDANYHSRPTFTQLVGTFTRLMDGIHMR